MENENIKNLYESIDKSEYVKVVKAGDEVIGLITFDGGHTLNFYNVYGENTDMQSIGDFAYPKTPIEEAKKEIDAWIEEIKQDYMLE